MLARRILRYEVAPAEKENMPSLAGIGGEGIDLAVFSFDLGDNRIVPKCGLDAEIVADGAAMRVAHPHPPLGEEVFDTAYDFQVHTCKHKAAPDATEE